jgi:6-phosphogluconolactonase
MRSKLGALLLAGLVGLTGCTGFFPPVNNGGSGGGGGGGGGTTTGRTYVINNLTSTVSGFNIGTGALTSVPNMPFALGFVPVAAVVTVANTFLYVSGPGAIYPYTINSDGSLTAQPAVVIVTEYSLDVSPDGNWLVALNGTSSQLDIYQINQTTGALSLTGAVSYPITNASVPPKMVKVSPDGTYIFAALGSNGDVVFSFNTATGAAVLQQTLTFTSQTSDNGLAVDSTVTHLYIARSGQGGGLAVYTIGLNGLLTPLSASPFAAGAQPLSVLLDSTGKYAYVANGSDGNISGYSLNNGVATVLSGSPYKSGATVSSLALDSSKKYVLAAAFAGSPDLTMYGFDATILGKLDQVTTAATGTDPAGAVEVTASH